jgi:hypothetical protein
MRANITIQFAGFLADRQQVRGERREHFRARQRLRNSFAALHALRDILERIRHATC